MVNEQPPAASPITEVEAKAVHFGRLTFSNPAEREEHIQAFLAWLPSPLQEAPEIRWDHLPSLVMGYLIHTVADQPDAAAIALAVGSAAEAMGSQTLYQACSRVRKLFQQLRTQYGMTELAQLGQRELWERFVAERTLSQEEVMRLVYYEVLASTHLPAYLDSLTFHQRLRWEPLCLPRLPRWLIEKYGHRHGILAGIRRRRKERSDVLVPLFPLLVEIAQLRKQAIDRFLQEYRQLRARMQAGEIELPHHFQYTDRLFSIPEETASLADAKLIEHHLTLSLTLWDRVSWVREHWDQYGDYVHRIWQARSGPYASENNACFLEYDGSPEDLFWFGNLMAQRLFEYGQKGGVTVSRPGLLIPPIAEAMWLRVARHHTESLLFEPESLYRAILFAAALATLALTNGSRVSELLQVSATRFETVVVDELKNQQPTGRKIGICVQHLLPKGYHHESERQFFLISDMAVRLLKEIGELLRSAHGGSIPVVQPLFRNNKSADLVPEPYFFQWAASPDRRLGQLMTQDVAVLLRLLFHGLKLTTRAGEPIRVVTHLLRHVLATHARQVKNVPAEAVAYLLHHRMTLPDTERALSIPEATAYYSRMPVTQLLALLFEIQSTLLSERTYSYLQVPSPRTLEQLEEGIRAVFEQWGMIGPTVFGYCSAGLCVRPDNRALCLGCPYLVPHYSNLPKAQTWRQLHVLQAQLHDEQGHYVDAQQVRQAIQHLDDLIAMMELQIQTRQDGGYLPFVDTLPPAQNEEGETS